MDDPRRILHLPALLNARDLGGYPTQDGGQTRWRSLVRADDLVQLTPEGVDALADYGIRTVIDLRWPGEASAAPHPIPRDLKHVEYHQVSLLMASENDWGECIAGCTKEMWKCAVLDHTRPQLKRVLQLIAAADSKPLLFHCVAGKDRTGLIAALLLALANVVPEAIAYDYVASGERLREAYVRRYPQLDPEQVAEFVRCPEEGVYNMLDYLARQGGPRAFLRAIDLSGAEIDRLYTRLREA
jgi:protein-tyrosine phosphatase